ncbi:MAG: DnaJ domain-containing protein [Desulfococcaceae bacterium]|jgi:hypothetical protein|nr:DnaJ domain-containing protein [Desulfococcaceae bacterium]
MNEFRQKLAEINKENIRQYLCRLRAPCYESGLLRTAFPDLRILNASPLALYRSHFLLFHLLYRMQEDFYAEDKYLHIHFMRTFLAAYPEAGKCRFYDAHSGRFCKARSAGGECYCEFHLRKTGEHALDELSAKYFYLDEENFYHLDEESAAAFMDGTWELLSRFRDYEESLKILGIRGTPDTDTVKKKFRELAKIYHPDKGARNHEKFNRINRAYRLLLRIIPNMASS